MLQRTEASDFIPASFEKPHNCLQFQVKKNYNKNKPKQKPCNVLFSFFLHYF